MSAQEAWGVFICHTNHDPHSKQQEGLVDVKTQGWDWASPLHLWSISSHTSQSDSHDGNVSHGGPDSARHLRTTKCWNPAYLLHVHTHPRGAEPREQHAQGTAACSGCDTGRTHRLCSPKLRQHPSVARAHNTTTALKGSLKWHVKNSVFSSYVNCFYYIGKKKKRWKI